MARLTLTLSEAVAVWQRGAGGGGAQAVLPADDLPAVRSARCALRAPDVAALSDAAAPWPLQRRHWRRRHRRRRLKAWHRGGAGVGRGGEPGEHGGRGVGRERGLRQLQAVGLATALEHAVVGVVAARGGEDDAVQRVALLGREFSLRKHVGHPLRVRSAPTAKEVFVRGWKKWAVWYISRDSPCADSTRRHMGASALCAT